MKFSWHGDELTALVKKATGENLERAAISLKNYVKEHLSEPSNAGGQHRDTAGRFTKGDHTPSEPGEYPHKDTGRLRSSISHEVDKEQMIARVGTNVIYGKFLEIGAKHLAARPFLRPSYEAMKPELARILTKKI